MLNAAAGGKSGGGKVTLEPVKAGTPPPNQPVPRSDSNETPDNNAVPELAPIPNSDSNTTPAQTTPPTQVNEINNPELQTNDANAQSSSSSSSTQPAATTVSQSQDQNGQNTDYSSSKKKQKKGIRKIVPF
jgi:hypothetical protein